MADRSSPDNIAALEAEIAEAERKLAVLRHDGERHFIDDVPVHPELPHALRRVVDAGAHFRRAQVEHPPASSEAQDPLRALEEEIARCRELAADPHKNEPHFYPGNPPA